MYGRWWNINSHVTCTVSTHSTNIHLTLIPFTTSLNSAAVTYFSILTLTLLHLLKQEDITLPFSKHVCGFHYFFFFKSFISMKKKKRINCNCNLVYFYQLQVLQSVSTLLIYTIVSTNKQTGASSWARLAKSFPHSVQVV